MNLYWYSGFNPQCIPLASLLHIHFLQSQKLGVQETIRTNSQGIRFCPLALWYAMQHTSFQLYLHNYFFEIFLSLLPSVHSMKVQNHPSKTKYFIEHSPSPGERLEEQKKKLFILVNCSKCSQKEFNKCGKEYESMKQQCQNTVLVIKFRTTLLMEIIRKVCIPQCQAKNCRQVWMLIDSHGRHIHSSHRGKLGSGEGGKTKLILIYPSNPSSEGKCSKFKD